MLTTYLFGKSTEMTKSRKEIIESNREFILNNYSTMTVKELSTYLKCSRTSLWRIFSDLGILTKVRALSHFRTLNESILTNTPSWYYFVGILMADGYVKGNFISIRLLAKDKQILEDLSKYLGLRKSLSFYEEVNFSGYKTLRCELSFSSKILSSKLKELGVVCRKTGIETSKFIPDEFLVPFVRGYFDGDGSVSGGCMRIYSAGDFVYEVANRLEQCFGIEVTKLVNKSIKGISIPGKYVKLLWNDFYPEGCLCLHRKRDSLLEYFNSHCENVL